MEGTQGHELVALPFGKNTVAFEYIEDRGISFELVEIDLD